MPDTGKLRPGTLPRMQTTGEICEREGVYEGTCACARWLPLGEAAIFPHCPLHGSILWQAVKLEAAAPRPVPESSARTARAQTLLADVA